MSPTPIPLREIARKTTLIQAPRLSTRLGAEVTLASETFQHTGSFKFRAAYQLASTAEQQTIITASSGNFGQALAYACRLLDKQAIVVMPDTSAEVKMAAVREYGGRVVPVDVRVKSRAEGVQELADQHPDALIASAYDHPQVIAGNASLGEELARQGFDSIVVPVGGGGISSGVIQGLRGSGNTSTRVFGAEPLLGNDAARSLEAGHIVANETEPKTIADGARTVSIGENNWAILKDGIEAIVEVPDENIEEAVRLLFLLANLKVEPTGALAVGALLTAPERFGDTAVCCVVTGGNVDPEVYRRILSAL